MRRMRFLAPIQEFLSLESASGLLMLAAAVVALALANSPLAHTYGELVKIPVAVKVGGFEIHKPLLLWINDGLMAVFFFLVGLELKRELLEGELASLKSAALPAVGAFGGMAVPAVIFVIANGGNAAALRGWAIPAATDIAFALGVLSLLGKRVPTGLKTFLVSLAIFDDIGAIVVIALFYTSDLSLLALAVAAACVFVLFALNRRGVVSTVPYVFVGAILWTAVLKSGVHATLAGVLLALFIPLRHPDDPQRSPLRQLEHDLHASVAFGILPLFAFANAGISFTSIDGKAFSHPVFLGIALGLFLGKQLGVLGFCWLGVRLGVARLPQGVRWRSFYGATVLCGIGFTMSLFIAGLAFGESDFTNLGLDRLGIFAGSLASGLFGYVLLRGALRNGGNVPPVVEPPKLEGE